LITTTFSLVSSLASIVLDTTTTAGGLAEEQGAVQPPPKRFKFSARPQQDRERERRMTSTKENDLSLYLVELNTLPEETNALEYWLLKKSQYPSISKLAQDLVSSTSSQAYIERIFSVCGDLSARKCNRACAGLERRVFLKPNKRELAKQNL